MAHKNFVKDMRIIGATRIFTNLVTFLLLPIIVKALESHYYGVESQISIKISLFSWSALIGLSKGIVIFFSPETNKEKTLDGFFSISIFVAFTGFIVSMLEFLLADHLDKQEIL